MNETTLTCPNCHAVFNVNESLAAPLVESLREQYEYKLSQYGAEVARRDALIREQQTALAEAQTSIDAQVATRMEIERERIASSEAKKARLLLAIDLEGKATEIQDLRDVLRDRNNKLVEAQKAQAKLLRREQELENTSREMDLTVERRVQESLTHIRRQAQQEAEAGLRLRLVEKEELIGSMQRRIEDLKRQAEHGSQQLQGEAQEIRLEGLLRLKFPSDGFEPVANGRCGGDLLQRVVGPQGRSCGTILWECKRTRRWCDNWLQKLRADQRAAHAEIALLVSQVLPKGVDTFGCVDGVWVTESRYAIPLAIALRQYLAEISAVREVSDGQQTKMKIVYQYLTGPRFRQRIEAIVEKFADMQEDLTRERQAVMRCWAKREQQIRGLVETTAGMFGDLQGIVGQSLPEVDSLQLPLLDNHGNETP